MGTHLPLVRLPFRLATTINTNKNPHRLRRRRLTPRHHIRPSLQPHPEIYPRIRLKSALNSATNNKDPTPAASIIVDLDSALSDSETTISVNWIGGGQISNEHEHENNKWSLEELIRAAASFPARVSKTPTSTHAILTKYNSIPSFLSWAQPRQITIPQYDTADSFARELLDTYMAYKGHMRLLQDALAAPEAYHKNEAVDAVDVSIRDLVTARKMIRAEMAAIVDVIDEL
jgi:hypothetical protein